MQVNILTDPDVGGTFISWSLYYLTGHKEFFNVAAQIYEPLVDNPLTKYNSHGHRANHPLHLKYILELPTSPKDRLDIFYVHQLGDYYTKEHNQEAFDHLISMTDKNIIVTNNTVRYWHWTDTRRRTGQSRLPVILRSLKTYQFLFFCIATNVETGKPVVLEKGSLAQAISASGAFPSLFQPVTINNQILIDGGVVNNYPLDELRVKGMDIIIGVDVQDDLSTRENLKSAPEILLQINNYRTIRDMVEKSKKTDVYIKPDIKGFTVVSFDDGKQIIKRGEIAALNSINELKKLPVNINKNKPEIPKIDSLKISNIYLSGNENYTRAYILGKLKIRSDEETTYSKFTRGVNNLVATNNFDSFLYSFKPNNGGYDLYANLKESNTKTYLKLGAHYDDLYKSAALINLTQKRLLLNNDVASLDVILGDNIRYNFEYYIDKGFYWSIGLRSRYNTFHKNVNASLLLSEAEITTTGLNKLDIQLEDLTNQFYLQTLFRKDFSLSLGAELKRLKITSETIVNNPHPNADETTFENSDFFSLFGKLKFDTYSNKYFPKNGFLFDGDFHLYLSSSDFNNNFAQFSFAKANIAFCVLT